MRIAYVASVVPRRRELASGPIDAEWIVDEREQDDIVVFVDYESDGTLLLQEAGIPVHVAPKRTVLFAEGNYETSDHLQARVLLQLHGERPFDVILYDSAHTTDWAWHQPELGAIPRGVALGAGPIRDLRLVSSVPELFAKHGRALWALTGTLASADFLVSDAEAGAYGIDPGCLPVRYSLNPLPAVPPPAGPAAMVALVALSESPAGLASFVERALSRVSIDENTIIAIIHPDIAVGVETTRDIVVAGLPTGLSERVRIAEPSSDGVAEGLLAQAEVVVAARVSDLAVRAVSDAAAKVGSIVLDQDAYDAPRFSSTSLQKAPNEPPVLIEVDGPLDALVPVIDRAIADSAAIVLHTADGSRWAQRLWALPGSARTGLVMVCEPGPYLGEPLPARPAFDVLGFEAAAWLSIRRLMLNNATLHDVVGGAGSLANVHRVNLLTVPVVGVGREYLADLPETNAWVTDTGSLPQPILGAPTEVEETRPGGDRDDQGIKQWAESHGVRDRMRLALPWKWGLLSRAMRDRW